MPTGNARRTSLPRGEEGATGALRATGSPGRSLLLPRDSRRKRQNTLVGEARSSGSQGHFRPGAPHGGSSINRC